MFGKVVYMSKISSFSDLKYYLIADMQQLNVALNVFNILFDDIWRFQRNLRYAEYYTNSCSGLLGRILSLLFRYRARCLGRKLGFSVPVNVFGAGLAIAHAGTIVVNSQARIGKNCRIHVCVNIGADVRRGDLAPQLGDNVYIGPGAKIYGDITIGSNVMIGANAVVNKSCEGNCTIAGVPAKIISENGTLDVRKLK